MQRSKTALRTFAWSWLKVVTAVYNGKGGVCNDGMQGFIGQNMLLAWNGWQPPEWDITPSRERICRVVQFQEVERVSRSTRTSPREHCRRAASEPVKVFKKVSIPECEWSWRGSFLATINCWQSTIYFKSSARDSICASFRSLVFCIVQCLAIWARSRALSDCKTGSEDNMRYCQLAVDMFLRMALGFLSFWIWLNAWVYWALFVFSPHLLF